MRLYERVTDFSATVTPCLSAEDAVALRFLFEAPEIT